MAKDTFWVTSKRGSEVFNPLDAHVEDDLLEFIANVQDFSVGVVPANAPKKDEFKVSPVPANYQPPCTCRNFQGDHEEDCYWGADAPRKEDKDGKHSS